MKFIYRDLGHLSRGTTVVVELSGTEANVFLVDDLNFGRYQRGESYTYFGGHTKRSPMRLQAPATGRWTAVVDLGGYGGHVDASFHVLAA